MVQFICKNERATKLIPYGVYGNVLSKSCVAGRDTGLFNILLYKTAGFDDDTEVRMFLLEFFDKLTGKWYEVQLHGVIQLVNKETNEYELTHVSSRGREKDIIIHFKQTSIDRLTDANCRNF